MNEEYTREFSEQSAELQIAEEKRSAAIDGFYFTVIAGTDFGRVFLLDKAETVLGRSDETDIQVDDEKVSRKHLKISLVQSGAQNNEQIRAVVTDLNSTNGVFINGIRVDEQELRNGDKLRVGKTILKFEIKDCLDVAYHDRLYQQAICDPLTGLVNRHYFQRALSKFISLGFRHNRVLSMMMLDIDFFKKINDTYGHNVGDNVLKMVANMLTNNMRDHDVVARFGGEEFIILLPETALNEAVVIAERIRVAVEHCNFKLLGCQHDITISIGICELPRHEISTEEFIKRADEALYEAKTSGRNRVYIARTVQFS